MNSLTWRFCRRASSSRDSAGVRLEEGGRRGCVSRSTFSRWGRNTETGGHVPCVHVRLLIGFRDLGRMGIARDEVNDAVRDASSLLCLVSTITNLLSFPTIIENWSVRFYAKAKAKVKSQSRSGVDSTRSVLTCVRVPLERTPRAFPRFWARPPHAVEPRSGNQACVQELTMRFSAPVQTSLPSEGQSIQRGARTALHSVFS